MRASEMVSTGRSVSRRQALATAGMAAGAMLGAPLARAFDLGRARTVSIFHSTDLHGRILPTSTYEGLDDVGGFARFLEAISFSHGGLLNLAEVARELLDAAEAEHGA